jgi:hypothetical protein
LTGIEAAGTPTARMARKLRVQYPGEIYHLMNRGDRREAIFLDEPDRELFLDLRQSAQPKAGRIVQEELGELERGVPELAGHPKGDAGKVRIAYLAADGRSL